jgi:hypothetical protein
LQFPCSLPSSKCQRHLPTQVLCEFIASSIPVVCTTVSQNHVFHSPNIMSTTWIFLLLYPTTKYFLILAHTLFYYSKWQYHMHMFTEYFEVLKGNRFIAFSQFYH